MDETRDISTNATTTETKNRPPAVRRQVQVAGSASHGEVLEVSARRAGPSAPNRRRAVFGRATAILLALLALCFAGTSGVRAAQRTTRTSAHASKSAAAAREARPAWWRPMREMNAVPAAEASSVVAIVGATLVDGRGGAPVRDAAVVVRGDRIVSAGPRASARIPPGAQVVDATGLTLLPGLFDSHFHIEKDDPLPALYLTHGVTSIRDPGQWNEAYDNARKAGDPIPRLFLCGPHIDSPPAAYPADSYVVRDPEEARIAVNRNADEGASCIKVYFRLPIGLIRVVTEAAHARGIPVTGHLEIVDAADAIRAGLDGVEHATSFGVALTPRRAAEQYRQGELANNDARKEGRYEMWSKIDLDSPQARSVISLIVERGTFISPTLAVFERQKGDPDTTDMHVRGFKTMEAFVGRVKRAGARVVVGSHTDVPHAERGWAYQREMELLVESGLTPMQAIVAGTLDNARFFHADDRLGSVEAGKIADLVLVEGDPVADISAMRKVRRVMLAGRWVAGER